MKTTKIEWCDSTVNPTGFQCCGCELWNKETKDCYAGRFAERRAGKGAFDLPVVLKPGKMAKSARTLAEHALLSLGKLPIGQDKAVADLAAQKKSVAKPERKEQLTLL